MGRKSIFVLAWVLGLIFFFQHQSFAAEKLEKNQGLLGAGLENGPVSGRARIKSLIPGFSAFQAGLQVGDVVLKIDDKEIKNSEEMVAFIKKIRPGSVINLLVRRATQEKQLTARVSSRADLALQGPEKWINKELPALYLFEEGQEKSRDLFSNKSANKPKVIKLWATWCPACRSALPHVEDLARKHGDSVDFLAVSGEPLKELLAYAKRNKLTIPQYQRDETQLHLAYWAKSIPTYLFVSAEGILYSVQRGYRPVALDQALAQLMKNKKQK